MYALRTTISVIAMKCALGFCFETLATNSRAVAFTHTTYSDELSRGLKTSSFPKSKFLMATLFEWWNLMWYGRCKAVHIFSTIESVECTNDSTSPAMDQSGLEPSSLVQVQSKKFFGPGSDQSPIFRDLD